MTTSQRLKNIKELAKSLVEEIEALEQEVGINPTTSDKLDLPPELSDQLNDLCGGFRKNDQS